jgi:hypothetical protein
MWKSYASFGLVLLLYSTGVPAQQGLVGTYEGVAHFFAPECGCQVPVPVALHIAQAAEGKVTGTYQIFRYFCRGDYSAQGTYEGNKMTLQTSKGHADCGGSTLAVVLEGSRIFGKIGQSDIDLQKQ